ncbi:hypothetical protein B566_EDAN014060 [Ephemera danica]|nr:hypothetical protein B566_EDAN014060 [Ephemera danica]
MSETPSMSSETTFSVTPTPTSETSTMTPSSTVTISTTMTSSSTITTTIPTSSTTIGACPETPTCSIEEADQRKPYPPDCTKFIYCQANGSTSIQDCPRGKQFGPELLYCADPEIANCPLCQPITAV